MAKESADEEKKEEATENQDQEGKTGEIVAYNSNEVDEDLVDRAYTKIIKKFSDHVEMGVKEVGEYLISEFFDNDIEKARGKDKINNSSKKATLNQVFERFISGSEEAPKTGGPSKSWLYRAIDLTIQWKDMETLLPKESFQTYGNILLSHKAELLSVKDLETKKKLIHQVEDEKLTVRELREEISEINGGKKNRNAGLLGIIRNLENLDNEEYRNKFDFDNLKAEPYGKIKDLPNKIDTKKDSLQAEIDEMEKKAVAYKKYLKEYDTLKKNVEEAIPVAKENSKSKKTVEEGGNT